MKRHYSILFLYFFFTSIVYLKAQTESEYNNPIQNQLSDSSFAALIEIPYQWNDAEKQALTLIMSKQRFTTADAGTTFQLYNINHLKLLKDMLDIIPSARQLKGGGYDIFNPIDDCYSRYPKNPPSLFSKVHINYQSALIAYPLSSLIPAAFDVTITNVCSKFTKTLFIVNEIGQVGAGTDRPMAQYHFAIPNFQVGDRTMLHFKIDNTSNNEHLIFSNGPTDLFKVNKDGKVWAREFEINLTNPFPDYVFEKNYKLLPLNELERYIKENKHLPNIASANEYEKTGALNIGELNLKMMEKIEELTLYIINQQHSIENLQVEVQSLKKNK